MRSWLDTNEVRTMLGGVSQPRVSQLVKQGLLIVEKDPEGRLRYDRITVERYVAGRAEMRARDAQSADERKALHAEARDRFRRQRERERADEEKRQAYLDDLREREVHALELIAAHLKGYTG